MDNNNTFENYLIDAEGNWPTSVVVLLRSERESPRLQSWDESEVAPPSCRSFPTPCRNLAFFYFAVFAAQGIMSSARGGDVVGIWIEILFFGVPAAFSGFAAMEKYWRAARECRGES